MVKNFHILGSSTNVSEFNTSKVNKNSTLNDRVLVEFYEMTKLNLPGRMENCEGISFHIIRSPLIDSQFSIFILICTIYQSCQTRRRDLQGVWD